MATIRPENSCVTWMARALRLAVVVQKYKDGAISEKNAKTILSGPLTLGGARVDDSTYLKKNYTEIEATTIIAKFKEEDHYG